MATNFSILRTLKLKERSKLAIAGMHNSRSMSVFNADPNSKHYLLAGSRKPLEAFDRLMAIHSIEPRKNAVLATELVVSFSPEMIGKIPIKKWAEKNLAWVKNEFRDDAILSAELHMDESTPHIHFLVAPIIKKQVRGKLAVRLSAKDYFDGREKMQGLQDRYSEAMRTFGLTRGVKGSKAHHQKVKRFYSELSKDILKTQNFLSRFPDPTLLNYKNTFSELKKFTKRALIAIGQYENLKERSDRMRRQLIEIQAVLWRFRKARGILTEDEALKLLRVASQQRKTDIDASSFPEQQKTDSALERDTLPETSRDAIRNKLLPVGNNIDQDKYLSPTLTPKF